MAEKKKEQEETPAQEIIAAFDRERAKAQEFQRRHTETVRDSRTRDRHVPNTFTDRRRSDR
jgi:hypothetical protein